MLPLKIFQEEFFFYLATKSLIRKPKNLRKRKYHYWMSIRSIKIILHFILSSYHNYQLIVLYFLKEFNENIATPNKIMNFKSRKTTLKYAFELNDVPAESEYLEIKYPATYAKLSQDLSGETFSRVFGTNTSGLEVLLLDRKIKGPCWLEIKNPQTVNVQCSWCKLEVRCSKPEDVIISDVFAPPPPLTLMTINIRTVVSKNMDNEIVMIGVIVNNQYRVSL